MNMYINDPLAFYKLTCIMRFKGSKTIFAYILKVFLVNHTYTARCLFLIYQKKHIQCTMCFFPETEGSKLLQLPRYFEPQLSRSSANRHVLPALQTGPCRYRTEQLPADRLLQRS